MRYLGGKSRLAKRVAELVVSSATGRRKYIEPFLGGGSVFAAVWETWAFDVMMAGDANADLMAMWRAAAAFEWLPPTVVTEDDYRARGGGIWRNERSSASAARSAGSGSAGSRAGGRTTRSVALSPS